VAFDAAAESSGHVGEHVIVRNPANGQRFRAVVEAHGKVGIRK
jgi:flagella basal body P-ring formation protein FlgA